MNTQSVECNQQSSEQPALFNMDNVQEQNIVQFPFGLPGFEMLTKFLIVELDDYPPFYMLQSLEEQEVTMLILNLKLLKVGKDIQIPRKEYSKIHLQDMTDAEVYVILKINSETHQFTANIRAPLVINTRERTGFQVILENDQLSVEHSLVNAFVS